MLSSKVQMNPNHRFSYRLKKRIIKIVFIILILLLCWFFSRLKTLDIIGLNYYTKEEMQDQLITKWSDHNSILFYLRYRMGRGNEIPFVQAFDIDFVGLNEVKIRVYEKSIVACIRHMNEYIYFDKDGTIVEITSNPIKYIPYITGIPFKQITLYQPLQLEDSTILSKIVEISILIQSHELPIDRIHFQQNGEVILKAKKVRVLLGKQENYDIQIAELTNLLPKALQLKQKGVLDMENFQEGQGKVVFRPE